jgi:hypothetical protein
VKAKLHNHRDERVSLEDSMSLRRERPGHGSETAREGDLFLNISSLYTKGMGKFRGRRAPDANGSAVEAVFGWLQLLAVHHRAPLRWRFDVILSGAPVSQNVTKRFPDGTYRRPPAMARAFTSSVQL